MCYWLDKCSSGQSVDSGSCANNCTISAQTGLSVNTQVASGTSSIACDVGYEGNITYSCLDGALSSIVNSCSTSATCDITSISGITATTPVAVGSGSLTCDDTNYDGNNISYTCNANGVITTQTDCACDAPLYLSDGTNCVGSGASMWLDASDVSSLTLNSNSVNWWNDKAGANNMGQSGGLMPVSGADINGLNAIEFDGVNDYMVKTGEVIARNNGYYTIAIVFESYGSSAGALYVQSNTAGDTNHYSLINGTGFFNDEWRPGGGGGTVTSGEPTIVVFGRTNWDGRIYKNGSLVSTGVREVYSGSTGLNTYIGARVNSSATTHYQGKIGEIITFPTFLSDSQRQQVENYLSNKWDIEVTN